MMCIFVGGSDWGGVGDDMYQGKLQQKQSLFFSKPNSFFSSRLIHKTSSYIIFKTEEMVMVEEDQEIIMTIQVQLPEEGTNHHSNHTITNQTNRKYGVHMWHNNIFQTVVNGGLPGSYVH